MFYKKRKEKALSFKISFQKKLKKKLKKCIIN